MVKDAVKDGDSGGDDDGDISTEDKDRRYASRDVKDAVKDVKAPSDFPF